MRIRPALILVLLGACTIEPGQSHTGKARFADYPEALIGAVRAICDGPAQTFARPQPDLVECREYLPPEQTAAIILKYDGVASDLPQLVVRFRTRADQPGYVVESDMFLSIPQKTGAPLQVRQDNPRLNRKLARLYRHFGGVPEQPSE